MQERMDILFRHEELLHKNIRFADQKAAVLITLNLAILTVLSRTDMAIPVAYQWVEFILYAALASVVLGSFGVLRPRGRNYGFDPDSTALPKDLGAYKDALSEIARATDVNRSGQLEKDLQKLVVQRAKINRDKYNWLNVMTVFCFCVWALSAVTLAALSFAS